MGVVLWAHPLGSHEMCLLGLEVHLRRTSVKHYQPEKRFFFPDSGYR
jgi:hypothetical protein